MHLESNLSWTLHMDKLLKKMSVACYMMRNLYYYLTLYSLKRVYFAHFPSLLQFGIIFCGLTTNLRKVHITQKRIIRLMLGLPQRTSSREKFKRVQILTVPSFYILGIMMLVIKNLDMYQTNVSNHSKDTRQKLTSFTISKTTFSPKGCLLFLNKDI